MSATEVTGVDVARRRVLVTSADRYMGPALVEAFRAAGAVVLADTRPLVAPDAPAAAVAEAEEGGPLDVLVANLGVAAATAPAAEIDDVSWLLMFDELVHPLMRLVRAALPAMVEQRRGKVVAITSSSPLRPIPRATPYASARAAQNTFITYVGTEVARHGVQVNAIAQNYIENPLYYPASLTVTERFQAHLARQVPAQRLGRPEDTARLALFLASPASDFFCGRVVPLDGGWSA